MVCETDVIGYPAIALPPASALLLAQLLLKPLDAGSNSLAIAKALKQSVQSQSCSLVPLSVLSLVTSKTHQNAPHASAAKTIYARQQGVADSAPVDTHPSPFTQVALMGRRLPKMSVSGTDRSLGTVLPFSGSNLKIFDLSQLPSCS